MKRLLSFIFCMLLFTVAANAFESGGNQKIESNAYIVGQIVQPINLVAVTISGKLQVMFINPSVQAGVMVESVIRSQRATAVYLIRNRDVGWQSYIAINYINQKVKLNNIGYICNQNFNPVLQTHMISAAKDNVADRNFLRFYC